MRTPVWGSFAFPLLLLPAWPASEAVAADWLDRDAPNVRLVAEDGGRLRVKSADGAEFTLESARRLDARPGDAFELNLRIQVGIDTRAVPELACYDATGKEIPGRSALANAPNHFTTNEQHHRRVFAARPGTVSVRARVRAIGRGEVRLSGLEFRPVRVDPYETGMLVDPLFAGLRTGVVLESHFGVVNREQVSSHDRDGDGRWALIEVDLDRITMPSGRGEDWRSRFELNPNAIFWSDGAVLKSDTVRDDRVPSRDRAIHFKGRVRPGPYRVRMSDPGRAVAISLDGSTWARHEGGAEVDLEVRELSDGVVEFWLDPCYRDPVSAGPVYFDYVRLVPAFDAAAIDRLFQAARQMPRRPERGAVDRKEVEITVQAPRFEGGAGWPVRCGLPIPRSELDSAEHAVVEDLHGTPLPCQARVLATWPDGSVKWLFIDFFHDFSRSGEARYRVVYGNAVRRPPVERRVNITAVADGLDVDTGAVRFIVPKAHFGIVENVRRAGGEVVQSEPISAEIVETGGTRWRALDLPVERLEVEQAGPLHAVVVAETRFPRSGKPARGFTHRARIHAYAGSPLVQVEYFVANTDDRSTAGIEGSMAGQVGTRSVALKVRPSRSVRRAVTELGATDGAGSLVHKTADLALAEGREQERRLRGWLAAELEGGGCLGAGLEGFREQFPKAVRWGGSEIELDLWAEEGGEFSWIEGVGKTHHLALYYGRVGVAAELLAHGRVLAVADPEWYCASGAFGPIEPAARSPLPEVERTLARHMRESVLERAGLGFEDYGDHSSGGYVKGTFLWDNNEYDLPAACLVHFARTGDRDALRMGLASALHYVDVDTIHYSSRHADWARAQHVHSHATFGHHTAQGPNMNHAGYVQGLIWSSYLTGEPAGLDGAKGIAAWVLRNLDDHTKGMERQLGHPLMTLNDVYESTWDDRWLRGSARLVDQALRWEHPVRSGFLAPITESPAYSSGSPFCGGLITAALLKFNGWARLPEIDRALERVATWTLTDVWLPPAGIQGKGGSPRRKGEPQSIASHLRLMATLADRTTDPFFLAVPLGCLNAGFGTERATFGTRETGLVFNYLPWFLTTLHAQGSPTEAPELELKATVAKRAVRPGEEFPLVVVIANRGNAPVDDLELSCRGRLDFAVSSPREAPRRLAPGEAREVAWTVRAPADLSLTCRYNRVAYIHVAIRSTRGGRAHVGHAWVEVSVEPANEP